MLRYFVALFLRVVIIVIFNHSIYSRIIGADLAGVAEENKKISTTDFKSYFCLRKFEWFIRSKNAFHRLSMPVCIFRSREVGAYAWHPFHWNTKRYRNCTALKCTLLEKYLNFINIIRKNTTVFEHRIFYKISNVLNIAEDML